MWNNGKIQLLKNDLPIASTIVLTICHETKNICSPDLRFIFILSQACDKFFRICQDEKKW